VLGGGACASTGALEVADPVGPDPRAAAAGGENGGLIVFTDLREAHPTEDIFSDEIRLPYSVFDAGGREVARVDDNGYRDTDPAKLLLPPGSYRVRGPGLSSRGGLVREPEAEAVVRIDRGKTTVVHFDAPWKPPNDFAGQDLAARALPDWRVGWSAEAPAKLGLEGEVRYAGSPTVASVIEDARRTLSGMTFSVTTAERDPVGDLALGTAELAGVAGEVAPRQGLTCEVIGYDRLAVVVREDSPLHSLSAAEYRALLSGELRSWSSLSRGGSGAIVLLSGAGTGAETAAAEAHALVVDPKRLLQQVANARDAIGLTSRGSSRGAAGVREVDVAPDAAASMTVPLTLCAPAADQKAQEVVRWAGSEEEQRRLAQNWSLQPAARFGAAASRR
jgi:phosphate transport system substrate-binding protein